VRDDRHPHRLKSLVAALNEAVAKYGKPAVASLHPRTADKMKAFGVEEGAVKFVPPMGLFDFVRLEKEAFCVLSDSGTVQEECCIFGVPTVTMRDVTERPETIECGSNILAGVEADRILPAIDVAVRSAGTWTPPAEYLANNVADIVARIVLGSREREPRILVVAPAACWGMRPCACWRRTSRSGDRAAIRRISRSGSPTERLLGGLDATDPDTAYELIDDVRPDLVLNAVGIVKQRAEAKAAIPSIAVNSLWPHVLADACERRGARMVHVSTDCVFSGTAAGMSKTTCPTPSICTAARSCSARSPTVRTRSPCARRSSDGSWATLPDSWAGSPLTATRRFWASRGRSSAGSRLTP